MYLFINLFISKKEEITLFLIAAIFLYSLVLLHCFIWSLEMLWNHTEQHLHNALSK